MLAEEYAQQNLDLRLETINKNLLWLTEEVVKQEKKVTEAESAMAKYREQQNALSLEDRQNIVVARLNTLNDTATQARTSRLQKEASYNQVKSVDPKSDAADTFPVIATNLGVIEAKTRLNELMAEKARLSSRYLPGHPDLMKVEGQIESARAALVGAARARDRVRAQRIRSGGERGAQLRRPARGAEGRGDGPRSQERRLLRSCSARPRRNRQIYQSLLQQQKELRVVSNSRTNNVRSWIAPKRPVDRSHPMPVATGSRRSWRACSLRSASRSASSISTTRSRRRTM